jgi:hypothetical protein
MGNFTYTDAPSWFPGAVANEMGWINSDTGEVLVAINDLDAKQTDINDEPTFAGVISGGKGSAVFATTQAGSTGVTQEIQTLTVSANGGTYTITYSGQTTTALAYNISAGALQTALEALSNITPGDVTVTGSFGAGYTLTWDNALGNVAQPTSTVTNLTGGVTFVTGNVLKITVTASEEVTVDGLPQIALTINSTTRQAIFDPALSTATSLVFKYTIVAGDVATAGQFSVATSMSGGYISDNLASGGSVPLDNSFKVISAITTTAITVN